MANDMMKMMAALGLSQQDMEKMMTQFGAGGASSVSALSNRAQLGNTFADIEAEVRAEIEGFKRQIEEDRRLGPAPSPPVHRPSLINALVQSRATLEQSTQKNDVDVKSTYVGHERHYSTTPLSKLRRIEFAKMQIRKAHKGHYLLCRLVTPPTRIVATQICIEDPTGDVRSLSIYNYPGTRLAPAKVLDTLFPTGTIIAIREPYLKIGLHDGAPFVRVDSPSDIVFIKPSDLILDGIRWKFPISTSTPVPRTANGWKDLGNGHFKSGQYFASVVAYSNGLDVDPSVYLLQLNRAAAYLRLEYFSAALSDAKAVLSVERLSDDEEAKALFRIAQAEYGLGQYKAAIARLEECLAVNAQLSEPAVWLSRCQQRLKEIEGKYDWAQMFKDARAPGKRVDVAEYVGPIKVQPIPKRGGGRGVITTRAVKAGELILVAKPFVACFPEELSSVGHIMSTNLITKTRDSPCCSDAMSQMFAKIAGNPELASTILDLYAGPEYPAPPPAYPPSAQTDMHLRNPRAFEVDLDAQRIESIYTYNAFAPQMIDVFDSPDATPPDLENLPSALYLLPSLINHACSGSASWLHFKNIMVIRATKDLQEGEEVTMPYTHGPTYLTRKSNLGKHLASCDCWLCEADRKDGAALCRQREKLLSRFETPPMSRDMSLHVLLTFLRDVEATYSASRGPIRPASGKAHHELATAYVLKAQKDPSFWVPSITEDMAALEAFGLTVLDKSTSGPVKSKGRKKNGPSLPIATTFTAMVECAYCVYFSLTIAAAFSAMGDIVRAKNWFRAGLWVDSITIGGGRGLFDIRYEDTLDRIGISRLAQSTTL
ncbi:hypothetical protein BOTBODRAFT_32078 [Botryobasidium botryosum FD-172 SS1]|uniref:SET domain-containing protein n=1 Tax=Botryobasidium botryosum (strain FD-172 SS1) TaxID=930990 RepID=A0A067MTA1_BOTB1|nr:hypothetical protein BOTBODRAFT_32078 [Botryobasidium botryosum FD-172 SS1]